jgi:conjugative transfer region protein (TIGR03750 family)
MAGEPPILRGCSSSELLVIAVAGIVFWLPVCTVVSLSIGYTTMGIGIAALLIGGTVWAGTFLFQVLKRGRPDAFYQHRILLALQRRRICSFGYAMPDGPLSIGRRRPCR